MAVYPELRHFPRHPSRREGPRLEVEAVLTGRLVRGNLQLGLHDLGFGGFAIESPFSFITDSRHAFRFTTVGGLSTVLTAETVYSHPIGTRDGMDFYLSGFKYILDSEEASLAVQLLISAATSPLSFL